MTPTQAQIEAVKCLDDIIRSARQAYCAITAAAEVAVDPTYQDAAEAYVTNALSATIERCAQVAESWKQGASTESKGIAAAIRALKDK